MSGSSFCPCDDHACDLNPVNHDKGCDLCVEDSVKTREIPKCFFMKVRENVDDVTDWSFESFADFVSREGKK